MCVWFLLFIKEESQWSLPSQPLKPVTGVCVQVCRGWDSSLWAEDVHEGGVMIQAEELDCRSHAGSPVRRRGQERQNRARGPLNRSCSVPDSNNPPCPPPRGDISVPVCDLTEIGAEEPSSCNSPWRGSSRRDTFNRGQSCDSYPLNNAEETPPSGLVSGGNEDTAEASSETEAPQRLLPESASPKSGQSPPNHRLYVPNNHMTKSMLCLSEESQDEVSWILNLSMFLSRLGVFVTPRAEVNQQFVRYVAAPVTLGVHVSFTKCPLVCLVYWVCLVTCQPCRFQWISLGELLGRCGRRLTVDELWALCYTCLSSLQSYIDFPGDCDAPVCPPPAVHAADFCLVH